MIRISLPWLVEVLENIEKIGQIEVGQTVTEAFGSLFLGQHYVEMVFNQSIYGDYLRASRGAAAELHEEIERHLKAEEWEKVALKSYDVETLKLKKDKFRTIFLADLSVIPSYLVARKDNFDVSFLIESGVRLFPPQLMAKVPEIEHDALEVGRALAFELPTACGFHTFRVMESVVRRYWDQVSSGKDRPKLQTLGNFAAEMEKGGFGDEKVIEAIKQMTKLHRNPLIHPEVILTVEEAIGIIGMARSVIAMMLQSLPDVAPTTGAP